MKFIRLPLIALITILTTNKSNGQGSAATLDVVSWNMEWFGSASNGPSNDDVQEANAKKIMRWLNADIYGVVEIVDTMRFRRLVDSLGNTEYGFVIAPYCTQATTNAGAAWLSGQKQAFIYRKSVFSNITTRGLMRNSSQANVNFASGRFPFMFSATATINGSSRNLNFIVLHAKAGSTIDDFNKRLGGAIELKDTLDAYFSNTSNMIIGDFNDALTMSISGASVSSYYPIVDDSTDADHYRSITIPLERSGQSSMINFPNVIDNHIISNEIEPYYVPGSIKIKTDVVTQVPDYVSGHSTSDHYPVFSSFNLAGVITSVPTVDPSLVGIRVYPNPVGDRLFLQATKNLSNTDVTLTDLNGQVIRQYHYNLLNSGTVINPSLPHLSKGIYLLQVQNKQYKAVIKLIHY